MGEKLTGTDMIADDAIEAIQRSTFFVAIVSPRYIRSEWTSRELAEFEKAADRQGGIIIGGRSRCSRCSRHLCRWRRCLTRFGDSSDTSSTALSPQTGKVREFARMFGPEAERDFWLRLDDLASDISSLIE